MTSKMFYPFHMSEKKNVLIKWIDACVYVKQFSHTVCRGKKEACSSVIEMGNQTCNLYEDCTCDWGLNSMSVYGN